MKARNIIIGILVLLSLVLSLYAYAQKIKAEQSEKEALVQREIAESATIIAAINMDSLNVTKARCETLNDQLELCRERN